METKTLKTDLEKKADMIKKFSQIMDKHCMTPHDVWSFIRAMLDGLEFLEDKRYCYRTDLSCDIRAIRSRLIESNVRNGLPQDARVGVYDDLSDNVQTAIMISGTNADGLNIFLSMQEDLSLISNSSY